MKKAKVTLKKSAQKSSDIKQKAKASPLVASVKSGVKNLAKGLVKAMSSKSVKKPLTKTAPVKSAKPMPKAAPKKMEALKKPAPVVSAKPVAPVKLIAKDSKVPAKVVNAPIPAKGKVAPQPPVVSAILTKGKGKEVKAKGGKLTGAQLAEHLEKMCRETACENLATTKGYCRLDYIKNWKKIKRKEMILKEGKLNQYIEELVSKYPEKYIDVIRQDLNTEVNFNKVIHDLELDESIDDLDYDGDSIDALIGGIKKESEDFGDEDF